MHAASPEFIPGSFTWADFVLNKEYERFVLKSILMNLVYSQAWPVLPDNETMHKACFDLLKDEDLWILAKFNLAYAPFPVTEQLRYRMLQSVPIWDAPNFFLIQYAPD